MLEEISLQIFFDLINTMRPTYSIIVLVVMAIGLILWNIKK